MFTMQQTFLQWPKCLISPRTDGQNIELFRRICAVFEGLNPCSSSMKARDENTLSKSHVKYKVKGNKGGNKQIWKSNQHFPKAQELICIRFWDHVLFISNHNQSGEKLINESVSRSDPAIWGSHLSRLQPDTPPHSRAPAPALIRPHPLSTGLVMGSYLGDWFFFSPMSSKELHMARIKGVAGCMVLLYCQPLLLIRKQDQRQY